MLLNLPLSIARGCSHRSGSSTASHFRAPRTLPTARPVKNPCRSRRIPRASPLPQGLRIDPQQRGFIVRSNHEDSRSCPPRPWDWPKAIGPFVNCTGSPLNIRETTRVFSLHQPEIGLRIHCQTRPQINAGRKCEVPPARQPCPTSFVWCALSLRKRRGAARFHLPQSPTSNPFLLSSPSRYQLHLGSRLATTPSGCRRMKSCHFPHSIPVRVRDPNTVSRYKSN